MVFTELNPKRSCTVNIATSIETMSGRLTIATSAPSMSAIPPRISVRVTTQAVTCGNGTPICASSFAKAVGPRLHLAQP